MKKDWTLLKEMPNYNQRTIIFDIESTGLNHSHDHIVELSAIEMENGQFTGNQFQIFLKPRVRINKSAVQLHGLQNNFFDKNYKGVYHNVKDQLEVFLQMIGDDSILLGHNSTFDFYFLNDELKLHGLREIKEDRFRCTLRIIKNLVKNAFPQNKLESYKLKTCCDFFKIVDNNPVFHNGLYDCFMTGILFNKLKTLSLGGLTSNDIDFKYLVTKILKPKKTKLKK